MTTTARNSAKAELSALAADVLRIRRYHTVGDDPNDTSDAFQRRRRFRLWIFAPLSVLSALLLAAFFTVVCLYFPCNVPISLTLLCMVSAIGCCVFPTLTLEQLSKFRRGRWIITQAGLFFRYGKDEHRFVCWNEISDVKLVKGQVVSLTTANGVIGIPIGTNKERAVSTSFLPFLNMLVERLRPLPLPIQPLLALRDKHRKGTIIGRLHPLLPVLLLVAPIFVAYIGLFAGAFVLETLVFDEAVRQAWKPAVLVFGAALFVGSGLWSWQRIKRLWKEADAVYEKLLNRPELVRAATTSRFDDPPVFGEPPRTVTPLARWRFLCRWETAALGAILSFVSLLVFVPIFYAMMSEPTRMSFAHHPMGMTIVLLGLGSTLLLFGSLVLAMFSEYRTHAGFFANGRLLRGRVRKISHPQSTLSVVVVGEPNSPFTVPRPSVKSIRLGDPVDFFNDPDNSKRTMRWTRLPRDVHYDVTTNTFDADTFPLGSAFFIGLFSLTFLVEIGMFLFVLIRAMTA